MRYAMQLSIGKSRSAHPMQAYISVDMRVGAESEFMGGTSRRMLSAGMYAIIGGVTASPKWLR